MALVDFFAKIKNEEELVGYMMESVLSIREVLGVVSIVDNGSSDSTLDIIHEYDDRLNIIVQNGYGMLHHGQMHELAMTKCTSPWLIYADGDETWTSNMLDFLKGDSYQNHDIIDFYKYSTIVDRFHNTKNGGGPSTRMFRNLPTVRFPQNIHTYPLHVGGDRKMVAQDVYFFDATAIKSEDALWAKGIRYNWAKGTPGIGDETEYIVRVKNAFDSNAIEELPEHVKKIVFTGP